MFKAAKLVSMKNGRQKLVGGVGRSNEYDISDPEKAGVDAGRGKVGERQKTCCWSWYLIPRSN